MTAAHAAYELHADLLAGDSAYREAVTQIARTALDPFPGASWGMAKVRATLTDDGAR